jgi:hypothetical protein
MKRYVYSTLIVLGLGYAALAASRPSWATAAGLDLWNLRDLEQELAAEQCICEEMSRQQSVVVQRSAAKEEVLHELVDDRLSLLQAAAKFRRFTVEPAEYPGKGPEYLPGNTEGERYCREVLEWAKSEPEEIQSRLESELEAVLAAGDGEVILPEDDK